jgi:FkbM family methyltransferase
MKIIYGTIDRNVDVTNICFTTLNTNNIIVIPQGDIERSRYFSDPHPNISKKIYLTNDENIVISEYNESMKVTIDLLNKIISLESNDDLYKKLSIIHNQLKIKYGNMDEELSEQKMAMRYLTGNEKILEIGGNIGRNSLLIAKILGEKNSTNLVSLESDSDIANQLCENRDLNGLKFHVESSALSKRNLIQKDWETIESDVLLQGYKPVSTITLEQLYSKYAITFDTLVLDCEGAFYYILMDMPEILNNITLIIMENDYLELSKKEYVDSVLKENGFYIDYTESLEYDLRIKGGWKPCFDNFYEVWKR